MLQLCAWYLVCSNLDVATVCLLLTVRVGQVGALQQSAEALKYYLVINHQSIVTQQLSTCRESLKTMFTGRERLASAPAQVNSGARGMAARCTTMHCTLVSAVLFEVAKQRQPRSPKLTVSGLRRVQHPAPTAQSTQRGKRRRRSSTGRARACCKQRCSILAAGSLHHAIDR